MYTVHMSIRESICVQAYILCLNMCVFAYVCVCVRVCVRVRKRVRSSI